jgi:hypothetical protein
MWRRLQKIGAVPVKNAVYVLPRSDPSVEDFHWVAREIIEAGGDASVCEATFIEGITNNEVIGLFQSAWEADYKALISEIKEVEEEIRKSAKTNGWASGSMSGVSRLRHKLNEIEGIDFFSCPAREQAESLLANIETKIRKAPLRKLPKTSGSYSGRTWVTRKGIHVDRIASAWLIRRFIDPDARFKFVIHDIDIKDTKFGGAETAGIALVVNALCTANKEDSSRLERGTAVLDDLYEYFKKR